MNRPETDDPVKGQLLKRKDQQQGALQDEIKVLSERTEKIITTALIAGGALVLAYVLYTELAPKKRKKTGKHKKKESEDESAIEIEQDDVREAPGLIAQIGANVANQAVLFLLDMARAKLSDYVEAKRTKEE